MGNVVKANPTQAASASAPSKPLIDSAAVKLSEAAYPLMKDVDWTSDLFSKPIPGQDAQAVLKAVDKMIVMGSQMDGGALQAAARAHAKAIEGMDSKGVLSQAIASVPTSTVMDVYNSMAKVVGSSGVPNKLYSTVNPGDAQAAYNALLEFKDVVKASQR